MNSRNFDLVVIGASAGGIEALSVLFAGFSLRIDVPIFVVLHRKELDSCLICDVYRKRNIAFNIKEPEDSEKICDKTIYFCPPGKHLIINKGMIEFPNLKPVNFVKPSADVLFFSAALAYRDKVIGVVLSGTGKDGAKGIAEIKAKGGTTIVQDKNTSKYFSMPQAAIDTNTVDFVLPLDKVALKIEDLIYG